MAKKVAKKVAGTPKIPGVDTGGVLNGFPIWRMPVDEIRGADYNPRDITETAQEGLRASVDEFGMPQGLVWNKQSGVLVGGHQRLKVLPPGSETDVVVVDLDPKKEKALNLALNNLHIQGEWTTELAQVLDEIEQQDPELVARLALDDLRVDVPEFADDTSPDDLPPDDSPAPSGGGGGEPDAKITCPNCQYAW